MAALAKNGKMAIAGKTGPGWEGSKIAPAELFIAVAAVAVMRYKTTVPCTYRAGT